MALELLSFPSMLTHHRAVLFVPLVLAAALVAGEASAERADEKIAIGEISVPEVNAPPGVDSVTLRTAAEGEVRALDAAKVKRRVVVSLAVAAAADRPAVSVSVSAALRDAKSGTILAMVQGRARAEGGASSELRQQVLRAAVKSAVSQIPQALSGS